MSRLSVVVIVHNEERSLSECLASVRDLAEEIVVLDDGSTDATVEIARAAGARVEHRPFDDFGHQKQAALALATEDWVLSIDADERVTPELARDVRRVLDANGPADGYWVRRDLYYLGARLRFGGTGSDWVLRLARRACARFELLPVHEHLLVEGRTERLHGALAHVKYECLSEHVAVMNRYTDVIAARKASRGGRFHIWHLARIPWELFQRLVLRLGILDGRAGVVWAGMSAFYAFLKYAKMWRGSAR